MDKKFGNTLRNIRESKGLSLSYVCEGIVSKAHLSKFERGSNKISFDKLLKILKKMNVTLEEYYLIYNDFENSEFDKLLNVSRHYHDTQNIFMLQKLIKSEDESNHKLEVIMLKAILYDISPNNKVNNTEKEILLDYLFSVDEWGYYELILFANSVHILNIETLLLLSEEMLNRSNFYNKVTKNLKLIIQTLLNVTVVLINHGEMEQSKINLHKIENLLIDESFLFEKNVFLFVKGYLLHRTENHDEGIKLMKKCIEIFEVLNCNSLSVNYNDFLNNI